MNNLIREMILRNITKKEMAKFLGISLVSLYNKLNRKSKFTIDEAMALKNTYFKDCEYEYLFR